ncbi:MAG: SDR family oxidoreductase [Rhodospirillales bacterium]|nr:SDR family oxidoreductase [Rhodospirillales bacterium]
MPSARRLFCFGLGYSARVLARAFAAEGGSVTGTSRDGEDNTIAFDRDHPLADAGRVLGAATHLLSSIPPGRDGDPVLDAHEAHIRKAGNLRWIGYLSTTGVYGDTGGAPVDETAALSPTSERSRRRAEAEARWLALAADHGLPVHVFRLAGIYGPGRSQLDRVRDGTARRITRPGHLFSRIHVDDIAAVLMASMARPDPGAVYNVCDDVPVAPSEVTAYACELLKIAPPPEVSFESAAREMSPMALSFWQDNRRVDNSRIKRELGISLIYPDYKSGLRAVLAAEEKKPRVSS